MKNVPIAIVGISAIFPGSIEKNGFWHNICTGKDLTSDIPEDHWLIDDYYDADPSKPGKTYAKRGAFISDVPFDPFDHGISPSALPQIDTAQLLALVAAKQVLEDACGKDFKKLDKDRTSVILGVASATEMINTMSGTLQRPMIVKALREEGVPEDQVQSICDRFASNYVKWTEATFPGLLGNVVAGRIANRFDLGGTNCVVDAACAGSLAALHMAIQELYLGHSDLVITGGVDALNDIFMYMCFSKTPAMSPTGDIRPFADNADGTLIGEGIGMFALRRLDDAERDGDKIYAVLRGLGSSSDGKSKSIYAPRAEGQSKALVRAYDAAGYSPKTVELVEAHGTGTVAGDAAEFGGLKNVFENKVGAEPWCALGSVKSQIGHTKAAAGSASLFKIVMALHHKVLPPTIKIDKPNSKLGFDDSAFYLNTKLRPWIRNSEHPRRASASSFGFGGSNFHVTVEEYVGNAPKPAKVRFASSELILVSSNSTQELLDSLSSIVSSLNDEPLARVAFVSQQSFNANHTYRTALVVTDKDQAIQHVDLLVKHISQSPDKEILLPNGLFYSNRTPYKGKIAFLFPGQGSQYLEMGSELAMVFDRARTVWDKADDSLPGLSNVVFPPIVFSDEEKKRQQENLVETQWAQPAIGVTSNVYLSLLSAIGISPDMVAGHSFGEVSALYCADVLSEQDSIKIARQRGELMAEASKSTAGAMLAVLSPLDHIEAERSHWGSDVVVANYNSPEQTVLAGPVDQIKALSEYLTKKGIENKLLRVATAFHTSIVGAACEPFHEFLRTVSFDEPKVPVYGNTLASPYQGDANDMRSILANQLEKPVRFVEIIETMNQDGAALFIEVGPNSVLSDLVGRCLKDKQHIAVPMNGKNGGLAKFWQALARLAVSGVQFNTTALWEGYNVNPVEKTEMSKVTVQINGTNYGKAYPPKEGSKGLPKPNPIRTAFVDSSMSRDIQMQTSVIIDKKNSDNNIETSDMAETQKLHAYELPVQQSSEGWFATIQAIQAQSAETHRVAQQAMADSHMAYLKATEELIKQINGAPVQESAAYRSVPVMMPMTFNSSSEVSSDVHADKTTMQIVSNQHETINFIEKPDINKTIVEQSAVYAAKESVIESIVEEAVNFGHILVEVISEATGFPQEMLKSEMDLEADLGIDSIKRVEIFSSLQASEPNMPALDPKELAGLRTIGAIAEYLKAFTPVASVVKPVAMHLPSSGFDASKKLVEVIADATGFPEEMLKSEMDLEADLGIDSIKRVEIFSSLQASEPNMPALDPKELAGLRTIGAIAEYLAKFNSPSLNVKTQVPVELTPINVGETLVRVIAEATGFPQEMLKPEMDLEADFGIDSIKRVEIFSSLQASEPNMPALDPKELAGLRTIGAITDYLNGFSNEGLASNAKADDMTSNDSGLMPLPMQRLVLNLVEKAADGFSTTGLYDGKIAVIGNPGELANAIVIEFNKHGVDAERFDKLPPNAVGAVVLSGLAHTDEEGLQAALEVFAVAKSFAPIATMKGGCFVTVQDSTHSSWLGGFTGLTKTAALEWPLASVKAIDIERAEQPEDSLAKSIVMELLNGATDAVVHLTDNQRRLIPVEQTAEIIGANEFNLLMEPSDPVLVVSGGARGVTAGCIAELAKRVPGIKLALLGRTELAIEPEGLPDVNSPFYMNEHSLRQALAKHSNASGIKVSPKELSTQAKHILASREIHQTINDLEDLGAEVIYTPCDIANTQMVNEAVAAIRSRFGRIDGIVHGAGILADRLIADKTSAQFASVYDAKVEGLKALLNATREDDLRLILLFSSVAGRYGNVGQSDYSLSNEILNRLAKSESLKRGQSCVVRALNWGPWDAGMVTPELAQLFKSRGIGLIESHQGACAFADEAFSSASVTHADVVLAVGTELVSKDRLAVDLMVDPESKNYQFLNDHKIKGVPVVPMVLVMEWFAKAAIATQPKFTVLEIQDMKLVKGVLLGKAAHLKIIGERQVQGKNELWLMKLIDAETSDVRYTGNVLIGNTPNNDPKKPGISPVSDGTCDNIYGLDALFHGESFQVIDNIKGINTLGITGTLNTTNHKAWLNSKWYFDVALMDGVLQLAYLWGQETLKSYSLPARIKSFVPSMIAPGDIVEVKLNGQSQHPFKTVSDAIVCDQHGENIMLFEGIEMLAVQDVYSNGDTE